MQQGDASVELRPICLGHSISLSFLQAAFNFFFYQNAIFQCKVITKTAQMGLIKGWPSTRK